MNIEKLYPECKDNIWGGTKLKEKYGKKTDLTPCAESWELSFHKDGKTRIADGRTLEEAVSARDIGRNSYGFPFFPTLIKFIDAADNLSVQVHPSDSYALKNENSFGKTEMWYVVDASEDAGIYVGFNRNVTAEEYKRAIEENTLVSLLNFRRVKSGDVYFIPSETVHAIGKGCLIYEVQQNSNLTYRVYDYGRRDKDGNTRELHIDKALAVSNLSKYENKSLPDGLLGISKYFTVSKLSLKGRRILFADDATFKCISCVWGSGKIEDVEFSAGDSFFVPASYGEFSVEGSAELLITEIRKYYVSVEESIALINDEGRVITSAPINEDIDVSIDELLLSVNMSRLDVEIK